MNLLLCTCGLATQLLDLRHEARGPWAHRQLRQLQSDALGCPSLQETF